MRGIFAYISSVDQDLKFLKESRHETVEWFHPVALEQEVSVDVEIARVVLANFDSKLFLDILSVEIFADPVEFSIAQTAIRALLADIVNVLTSSLEWTDHGIVAVDTCRDTRPDTLAIITILDKGLAAGKRVFHRLAFALVENGRVSALTTGHGLVVLVLG
jgi:hypothetical protein